MADYAQQFDLDEPLRRSGELQKLGKTRRFRLAPDALEYSAGLKYGFTTRTIALGPGSVAAADGKLQVLPGAVEGRLTLGKLLRRLEGEADIVVDEPLARQWMGMSDRPDLTSAQMPGLIEDNILQRTPDDQIAVNLEYKQGRLWINGIENEQWAALMVLLDMGSLEIVS